MSIVEGFHCTRKGDELNFNRHDSPLSNLPCSGEKASVLRELDMKRTQLLWETQKLSEVEGRLHHSQQEQARVRRELTKLRMRLQETTEKLAQGGGRGGEGVIGNRGAG